MQSCRRAPKHLEAIQKIGGRLLATTDPNDNLEILDQYFPDCEYLMLDKK
jgi:UDP-N-acetyl-2-amino-2-deoxyglucuronate dehydrogenase